MGASFYFPLSGLASMATSAAGIVGSGGTPTVAVGTAAGTGATATIAGCNSNGLITLNVGTILATTGTVLTVTLASGFTFPGGSTVGLSSANAAFAGVISKLYTTSTTTAFAVKLDVLSLIISTTYLIQYQMMGW